MTFQGKSYVEDRIEALLEQMTLEEKVAMAAGSDMWHSTGVERLGIPPFKMTDGPNGARGRAKKWSRFTCATSSRACSARPKS